ncbi:hypothetical protein N0V93_007508 [Gnomoniopsis smithogilvyi]|uniref:Uncharacterized protein n=1 Tax=Gnomoniopsis smithogilvyi TaxID=1191159 RepID=A0A9W9CWN7_9PEZI|nr:hypothetical protein N0V93_007508 [Gnomoniopsis smithogilvyi]
MKPFVDLKKAYDKTGDIEIASLMQVLCIAHYRIANQGVFAFAYRQLEKLGLLAVLDYSFDWVKHIRGSKIMRDEAPIAPLSSSSSTNPPTALLDPEELLNVSFSSGERIQVLTVYESSLAVFPD